MRSALIALTIAAVLAPAAIARADWLDIYGRPHHLNCLEAQNDPACPAKADQDAYRKALKKFTDGLIPHSAPTTPAPAPAPAPRARGFDI